MNFSRHWLADPKKEMLVILTPLFLPVILIFLFNDYFTAHQEVSAWWWLVLVLMIDVSHVYSTLFRFYWEKNTFIKYKSLLIFIPSICFVIGLAIHLYDSFLFWRILAYMAVYHFIRQQYGFIRIYSRMEKRHPLNKWIDNLSIYIATLYPILFWHLNLTESLSWFVPNDFIKIDFAFLIIPIQTIFLLVLASYLIKEIFYSIKEKDINLPKNGIMLGTYLSWYVGIVLAKGDLTFTLLNVVAHGIPYMGLVWIYGKKKATRPFSFNWSGLAIFSGVLILLAYFEETLWDVLIWKDHVQLFPFFLSSENLSDPIILSVIVPLLVLPQVTHYVLDGFIWRFSKDAALN
jgi:hypothetical protein